MASIPVNKKYNLKSTYIGYLEFNKKIEFLENEENIYGSITTKNYETVRSIERLKDWIEDIRHHGYVAFDTETTGLDETKAELVGVSLCIKPGYASVSYTHLTLPTKRIV